MACENKDPKMKQWSVADHFAAVLAELNRLKDGYDTDDPMRYPVSMMIRAAEKAMFDGIRTAADILEAAKQFREHHTKAMAEMPKTQVDPITD